MLELSLLDFARNGRFGPVVPGQDRVRIRALLGAPDDWGYPPDRTDREAGVWKYGTTEFHFRKDVLFLIHSDDFDVPQGGARLHLDPWVLRRGLAPAELERAMAAAGLACDREPWPHQPGALRLRSPAGVHFLFADGEAPGPPGLSVFWLQDEDSAGTRPNQNDPRPPSPGTSSSAGPSPCTSQ